MANQTYVASPAMSWVDDYVSFMTTSSCCLFFEKNQSTCYSEDYYNDKHKHKSFIQTFIGDHEENEINDVTPTMTSTTSKVVHKEHLPDDVFDNYDDYYYYEDDSVSRAKRSVSNKFNCKAPGPGFDYKCCR